MAITGALGVFFGTGFGSAVRRSAIYINMIFVAGFRFIHVLGLDNCFSLFRR